MGLSVTQILFTIAAVVLAWRVIGLLERRRGKRPPVARDAPGEAVELVSCPRCGTYVAAGESCPHCAARDARPGG